MRWGGVYGLVKKRAGVDGAQSLAFETALLALPALAYIAWLQARGSGTYGPHLLTNLWVHDNEVRLLPRIGATGVVEDINDPSVFSAERRNRFERNRYVADCHAWQWEWRGPQTWASWQASGQDAGGSCVQP